MSIIADAIKGFVGTLLLKPIAYRDCKPGHKYGGTPDTEGYCYPVLAVVLPEASSNRELEILNPGAQPQDIIWLRKNKPADHAGIASGATCPPNLYSYLGSCLDKCTVGYVEAAYPDREKPGEHEYLFECHAEVEGATHALTWQRDDSNPSLEDDNERNSIWKFGAVTFLDGNKRGNDEKIARYEQIDEYGSKWCWHVLDNDLEDGATDGYSSTPFNIIAYENQATGVDGGAAGNKSEFKVAGKYGERMKMLLGAPRMAGSCPAPNVAGHGVCFQPTPAGMTLEGNTWFTNVQCPTEYTYPVDGGKQCAVKGVVRGKYPSILSLILYLAVILIVTFIVIKIVQALR